MPYLITISRPSIAFVIALLILTCSCLVRTVRSPELYAAPKAIGDGLEYENIGFHIWTVGEFRVNNKNRDWLALYEKEPEKYSLHLNASRRDMLTTGRPPLFPAIIAMTYSAIGRNEYAFAAIRLFSSLCIAIAGSLAVFSLARILKELTPPYGNENEREGETSSDSRDQSQGAMAVRWHRAFSCVAIFSCVFVLATNRTLVGYTEDFLTEPLSLLLLQIVILVMLTSAHWARDALADASRQSSRLGLSLFCIAGCFFGILILTRSVFVVWLPGVSLIAFLMCRGNLPTKAAAAVLFGSAACLVCCGWWIRNMEVLERTMPLGTQGPVTLLGTYSDQGWENHGEWTFEPESELRARLTSSRGSSISNKQFEILVAETSSKEVRGWVAENPGKVLGMFAPRVVTHWNPYSGRSLIWKLLMLVGVATALHQFGRVKSQVILLIGLPLLSTLVVALLYSVGGRFLVPLYGLLSMLSGLGVFGFLAGFYWLMRRLGDRHPRKTTV